MVGEAMSSAKEDILARILAANRGTAAAEPPRGYRTVGDLPPGDPKLLELLEDRLLDYKAEVHRASEPELDPMLAGICAGWKTLAPSGFSTALAGATADDPSLSNAELDALDAVVTDAAAACSETGTIVLDAGPGQGRRALTLIPDRHVCVVRARQVVQTVPELMARLDPLRPLTFISGPSATSDIELQRVEGVHGPRTLVVVLVEA